MDWTALVTQIPLVAAFIWYALEMQKRSAEQMEQFLSALDKRDTAYEERNNRVCESLEKVTMQLAQLTSEMQKHDATTTAWLSKQTK